LLRVFSNIRFFLTEEKDPNLSKKRHSDDTVYIAENKTSSIFIFHQDKRITILLDKKGNGEKLHSDQKSI